LEAWGSPKEEPKKDPYLRSKNKEALKNADDAVIIAGSSNPELASSVASMLNLPLC
jgi:hypothetical protein